jgi:hypothetical protein
MNDHFHAHRFSTQLPTRFVLAALVVLLLGAIGYQARSARVENPTQGQQRRAVEGKAEQEPGSNVGKDAYIVGDFCDH